KKAESAAKESRPYSRFLVKVFAELVKTNADLQCDCGNFEHALENYPALLEKREIKNIGLLILTSDKGLAGSYNANVIKEAMSTIKEYKDKGIGVKLFIVGLKGITALKKYANNNGIENIKNYAKIPPIVEVEVAKMIAEDLAEKYVSKQIDGIKIITTEFKSMLSYKVKKFSLLPLEIPAEEEKEEAGINPEMVFEPNKEEVLKKLVPLYFANTIYTALKEASASELASRMNAMSNATKNAEEIAKSLSITYNKIRQYSITQEILEVVSGANWFE
ncbi:MAG: ATP synthase F1 subunit gamma, partial [Candidatus Gastranaerophilales bacterium]|nr:ATP synthase F1 subunit gamma [Candidatus Gastranaerophilales bacterium]